jgi:hypothetical protein
MGYRDDEARPARLTDITAELVRETAAAFCINDGGADVWVPKSLVDWDGKVTFTMPEWLALDKEFI